MFKAGSNNFYKKAMFGDPYHGFGLSIFTKFSCFADSRSGCSCCLLQLPCEACTIAVRYNTPISAHFGTSSQPLWRPFSTLLTSLKIVLEPSWNFDVDCTGTFWQSARTLPS